MARAQKKSDDEISVMLKNKLVEMIAKAKDPATVVALTNGFAKLRAVELKADEGEFGAGLDGTDDSAPITLPGGARP